MNKKPHGNLAIEKNLRPPAKKYWYIKTGLILSTLFLLLSCDPDGDKKEEKVACPATSSPANKAELLALINPRIEANPEADLNDIDTGKITNMSELFLERESFNGKISCWNTANVTNMIGMFNGAASFDGNIRNWKTGAVTDMNAMFLGATEFNQNLSSWNTSAVTNMDLMFFSAGKFDQNLSGWDVHKVTVSNNVFTNSAMADDQTKWPPKFRNK